MRHAPIEGLRFKLVMNGGDFELITPFDRVTHSQRRIDSDFLIGEVLVWVNQRVFINHLALPRRLALLFGTRCQRLVSVGMVIGAGGSGPIGNNSICNIGGHLRSNVNHMGETFGQSGDATAGKARQQ
jgi:hypothetical protein